MTSTEARPTFWRAVFFLILATGLVIAGIRYVRGLGAVTHLSDAYPWGLWVGFDVLCGVGLAAGGFVMAAMVYVFHLRRFRPIVRPAILTAFLGYLLVVVALLLDLGRPWNLWRPLWHWNPRSVMFEVSWCVTLYTTVLALEISGALFERYGWRRAARLQHAITVPLVVAGVLLSTLHQSSLGAFYLIVPGKLHPFWYSSLLPLLFFVSSVTVGLAMVIVESRLSSRAFRRQLEMPLLSEVGRLLVGALGAYGVLRVYDLWDRGMLALAASGSYEARMLQLELGVGLVLPFLLLVRPALRRNVRVLYGAALLTVVGFVVHRMNVSITGLEAAQGGRYVPAWSEIAVTIMLVAVGFAAFRFAVRHLDVFPREGLAQEA